MHSWYCDSTLRHIILSHSQDVKVLRVLKQPHLQMAEVYCVMGIVFACCITPHLSLSLSPAKYSVLNLVSSVRFV